MAMLPQAADGGKNVSVAVLYGGTEKNDEVLKVAIVLFTMDIDPRVDIQKEEYPG